MKKLPWLVLIACTLGSVLAVAETVQERIKPVGSLCMDGDDCAKQVTANEGSEGGSARSGEDIYNKTCTTCHAAGIAGAPKVGDKTAWAPRIEKGLDALFQSAINGVNAMPAKGMCFDCSDDEIKSVVKYMVGQSK